MGCVAHHLLSVSGRGLSMKADDMWALPLTPEEHDRLHRECASKTEEEWFVDQGVLPHVLARTLWHLSGHLEEADLVVRTHRKVLSQ